MRREDLKVGETYRQINNQKLTRTVLFIGDDLIIYKINGREGSWDIKSFLNHWEKIPPPKKSDKFWVNISSDRSRWLESFPTRTEADQFAGENRIACVEVQWEEGQGI